MKHNYKLKSAVAMAASLIGLGINQNAFALGLSDINLKSYLGQPLNASIKVYGANDVSNSNCFKLAANGSDISHVNFKMGPVSADSATLTLTTNKVMNEPILNLSVVSQCGCW